MNPIKTFKKGGVHPEENKLSAELPIQDFPMPKQIIVPLGQCLGAPAECIVNKGDRVLTGQLIGTAKGFVSANVPVVPRCPCLIPLPPSGILHPCSCAHIPHSPRKR